MNLIELLKEEALLEAKIEEAITTAKAFFEKKMNEAKEIFAKIKNKMTEKLKNVNLGKVLPKDIGRFKKGTPVKNVVSEAKTAVVKAQSACNDVVKKCKEGINATKNKNPEKISIARRAVNAACEALKNTVKTVSEIGTALVLAAAVGTAVESIKDKIKKEETEEVKTEACCGKKDEECKKETCDKKDEECKKEETEEVKTEACCGKKNKKCKKEETEEVEEDVDLGSLLENMDSMFEEETEEVEEDVDLGSLLEDIDSMNLDEE